MNIGDRVVCVKEYYNVSVGMEGRIVDNYSLLIGVEWDKRDRLNFHTCSKKAKQDHGYWVPEENIKVLKEVPMEVHVGGIYEVKKECKDKCGTFNDNDGKYIRITNIVDSKLHYDILDKDKNKIENCWCCFTKEDLVLKGEPMKLKKITFIVRYDKYGDFKTKYFIAKKDALKRIDELVKDTEVSNITLIELGRQWEVQTKANYELKEVK
jgi:hypothetical protein